MPRSFLLVISFLRAISTQIPIPDDAVALKEAKPFKDSTIKLWESSEDAILVTRGEGGNSRDVADWTLHLTDHPRTIVNLNQSSLGTETKLTRIDLHISLIESMSVFNESLEKISKHWFRAGHTLVFFVCTAVEGQSLDWLEGTLRNVWQHRILRFQLIFYFRNGFRTVSYDPFLKRKTLTRSGLYDARKLEDLHGYRLKLGVFENFPRIDASRSYFQGSDIRLINETLRTINATSEIVVSQNESWSGIMKDLRSGRVDCSLIDGFVFYGENRTDYTYPYAMDGIAVVVPKAAMVPQYLHFFMVFRLTTWLSLIGLILALIAIRKAFERFWSGPAIKGQRKGKTFLEVFRVLVALPMDDFARAPQSERIFFIILIWSFQMVNIAFQSALISAILTPRTYRDINTLEELRQDGIKIKLSSKFMSLLPRDSPFLNQYLNANPTEVYNAMVNGDTSSAYGFSSKENAEFTTRYVNELHGKEIFHIVKETMIPGFRAYFCVKNSPYVDRMNRVMLKLREYGHLKYKAEEYSKIEIWQNKTKYCDGADDDGTISVLTLDHLQTIFYGLIIGYFVGAIVFVMEKLHYRLF